MNALSTTLTTGSGPLTGFRNYLAKDAREWWKTRRAFWTALAAQALLLLGVVAMRIAHTIDPNAKGIDLSANFNMFNAGWETVLPLCAVFSTLGFLIGERENRTLAWSLSMPLTRGAILLSKLVTTVVALGIVAVVLPLATTLVAVRLAYGSFPDGYSIWAPLLTGVALSLFLLAVNLSASTIFRSQRAVTAIALFVALVIPGLVGSLWAAASPWWPMGIEQWIKGLARGEAVNWITPLVYAGSIAVLLAAAQIRFAREEV
jgi:ABC-type transport system involved in multi-copper enzyme maturation permease subunit